MERDRGRRARRAAARGDGAREGGSGARRARRRRRRGRDGRAARGARRARRLAARRAARRRRAGRRVARGGRAPGRPGAAGRGALGRGLDHRPLAHRRPARLHRPHVRRSCRRSRRTRTWTRPRCRRSTCTRGSRRRSTILDHKLKHTRIAVERDYAADLPRVCVYGSELNQVWTNLLDNAIDALGETGTIRIATAPWDETGVEVTISDDGPGIPEDVAAPGLRAVLHHQGGRLGHRAGARHDAPDRARAPRGRAAAELPAGRDDVHRAAAAGAAEGALGPAGTRGRAPRPAGSWWMNAPAAAPAPIAAATICDGPGDVAGGEDARHRGAPNSSTTIVPAGASSSPRPAASVERCRSGAGTSRPSRGSSSPSSNTTVRARRGTATTRRSSMRTPAASSFARPASSDRGRAARRRRSSRAGGAPVDALLAVASTRERAVADLPAVAERAVEDGAPQRSATPGSSGRA